MIPFCGYVEGFRDPQIVASLSYDHANREFQTILRNSRYHMQSMQRLLNALKKSRGLLMHTPIISKDRRFLAQRKQSQSIEKTIDWIHASALSKTFDKNVLPFAFAFAREQAKQNKLAHNGSRVATEQDLHVNARLARFMANDWLEETGRLDSCQSASNVVGELALVQKWLYAETNDLDEFRRAQLQAWSSACLVPILKWEETMNDTKHRGPQEIVSSTAPQFASVPNDAIWSLAIHPGGVEAWLKSLVNIGYVPVYAPISSSGSTSTSVLEAAKQMNAGAETVVPAPLSISHAILSSTLSYLPAFLNHTNQRTLRVSRPGARASKEAAALKASTLASLEEENRLAAVGERDEENEESQLVTVASMVQSDLSQYSYNWKQVRASIPQNLASLFNQALATPFLSTSSSAAKKRKRWLQEAVANDSVYVSTFHSMHVSSLPDPPLNHTVCSGVLKNRSVTKIPSALRPKPVAQQSQVTSEPPAYLHMMFAPIKPAGSIGYSDSHDNYATQTRTQESSQNVCESAPAPQADTSIQSQYIIHELQIELNSRGWSEASSTSCCYLTSHDTCDICHIPMEQATDLPIQVCPMCQSTRMTLSTYGKQEENTPFSKYVRKAHFRTYMQQVYYQEQTDIDIEDIWRVAHFLAARGFNSTNGTVGDVRWALLELKMNKCYNHVTQIYCRVFNKPPPRFTPEQKQILFDMFDAIYDPYFSAPNKGRSNFLSYQVVIYKSCELQGWTKFLPYFKMLKGDHVTITHDIIWKYICEYRNWQFIRTLSTQYTLPEFAAHFVDPLSATIYVAKHETGAQEKAEPAKYVRVKQALRRKRGAVPQQ